MAHRSNNNKINDKAVPLMTPAKDRLPLYDATCMLHIKAEVAHGYVVLLGGTSEQCGKPSPKGARRKPKHTTSSSVPSTTTTNDDDAAIVLGFLALLEGNVMDACFGIHSMTIATKQGNPPKSAVQRQLQHIQQVKDILSDAADENDDIRRLAVEVYRQAFVVCMRYHARVKRLHCCNACFHYGKIRCEAEHDLQEAFAKLQDVMAASL
jgi:hypothetical protein